MDTETSKKLGLFHKRIERLRENRDFFTSITLNLDFKRGVGARTSLKGPDPKTIKAALADFRPFILNDEPVNFNFVCNSIQKDVTDPQIIQNVIKARDAWQKILQRKKGSPVGGLKMQINSTELRAEANMNTWLNTDYFHIDDGDARRLFERMEQTPFGQLSHFSFIDLIQRLCKILFWFDKLVIQPLITE